MLLLSLCLCLTQKHITHQRVIQPFVTQPIVQPIVKIQPVLEVETVTQQVLQPQLMQSSKTKTDYEQTQSTAAPITNAPQYVTLPEQTRTLPGRQLPSQTQPMMMMTQNEQPQQQPMMQSNKQQPMMQSSKQQPMMQQQPQYQQQQFSNSQMSQNSK